MPPSYVRDLEKLPGKYAVGKAHWKDRWDFRPTGRILLFGSLYTAPQSSPRLVLSAREPEIHALVCRPEHVGDGLDLPEGWSIKCMSHTTQGSESDFVGCWLSVPHRMTALGESIPAEAGYLVSACLQTGEGINFRNFENFRHRRKLKFLPFLVVPGEYRFYIWQPTPDRIQAGIAIFSRVLEAIRGLPLISIVEDAYAVVRLDELLQLVDPDPPIVSTAKIAMDERLGKRMPHAPHARSSLGFVYSDLPGAQDAQAFDTWMYGK